MKTPVSVCTTIFLITSGLASAASPDAAITGEALRNLHIDKTFEMTHVKQGPGLIYFAPDGASTMLRRGETQRGKWWIDDSGAMRCGQFSGKKPFCLTIKTAGDGKYAAFDNQGVKQVDIHKVMDGNALAD